MSHGTTAGILNTCVVLYAEKAMAPPSSTLAWKIPWTEEPGGLQSMGSLRVAHNWVTSLLLFTFMHWRRKWQPTPVFLPGESQGRGSLAGCQSRTRLKRLSSSSSSAVWAFRVSQWVKNPPATQGTKRHGFHPWVGKIHWRRAWQSTPVFLTGESHGQRSLVGYSP